MSASISASGTPTSQFSSQELSNPDFEKLGVKVFIEYFRHHNITIVDPIFTANQKSYNRRLTINFNDFNTSIDVSAFLTSLYPQPEAKTDADAPESNSNRSNPKSSKSPKSSKKSNIFKNISMPTEKTRETEVDGFAYLLTRGTTALTLEELHEIPQNQQLYAKYTCLLPNDTSKRDFIYFKTFWDKYDVKSNDDNDENDIANTDINPSQKECIDDDFDNLSGNAEGPNSHYVFIECVNARKTECMYEISGNFLFFFFFGSDAFGLS